MKQQNCLLLLFALCFGTAFGQKVYRVSNEAYRANKFKREFYVLKDSTCYLKAHYADNGMYALYKGKLRKINDTLAEFKYRPLAVFGENMRFSKGDSLNIEVAQKDTVLPSLVYVLKRAEKTGGKTIGTVITLQPGITTFHAPDFWNKAYFINTKFRDPLTDDLISMHVSAPSEPTLTYYGSNTPVETALVSISANKLIIYPDRKHIDEKETFELVTK